MGDTRVNIVDKRLSLLDRSFATVACWTCRRKRLKCDSRLPACVKCTKRGSQCLRYGSKKPLVWAGLASRGKLVGRAFDIDSLVPGTGMQLDCGTNELDSSVSILSCLHCITHYWHDSSLETHARQIFKVPRLGMNRKAYRIKPRHRFPDPQLIPLFKSSACNQ